MGHDNVCVTVTCVPPELLRDGRMSPAVDIYRYDPEYQHSCAQCHVATPIAAPVDRGRPEWWECGKRLAN
jgi:mono/diheme cytochrome c family protein